MVVLLRIPPHPPNTRVSYYTTKIIFNIAIIHHWSSRITGDRINGCSSWINVVGLIHAIILVLVIINS